MSDPFRQTLVNLVVQYPAATQVLRRSGIDFWSRGRRTLAEACHEAGLPPQRVLEQIRAADPDRASVQDWHRRPLSQLVKHLVEVEHPRLRLALADLVRAALSTGAASSGTTSGSVLLQRLEDLGIDQDTHMRKEEEILFPVILEGRAARAVDSIHAMEVEHLDHMKALGEIRADLGTQSGPAATGVVERLDLYEELATDHIHLENNILFPQAFFQDPNL